MEVSPNLGPRYTAAFENLFREVTNNTRAALVPSLFARFDETMFQRDDIHPTSRAQPVILDNIWPELLPMLR